MARLRKTSARVALVLLSLGICACGTNHNSGPAIQSVPAPNFAFQWTNPVAELTTPDATFVRAFEESTLAIYASGYTGYAYPGFSNANHNAYNADGYLHEMRGPNTMPLKNFQLRLGPIEVGADGAVRATICYRSGTADAVTGTTPERVVYRREGSPPPSNAVGRSARPTANMFGGWYAVAGTYKGTDEGALTFCDSPDGSQYPKVGEPLRPPIPGWPQ